MEINATEFDVLQDNDYLQAVASTKQILDIRQNIKSAQNVADLLVRNSEEEKKL